MAKIELEAILTDLPHSADAWIWHAWFADSLDGCENALKRALEISPDNGIALAGMRWVTQLLDQANADLGAALDTPKELGNAESLGKGENESADTTIVFALEESEAPPAGTPSRDKEGSLRVDVEPANGEGTAPTSRSQRRINGRPGIGENDEAISWESPAYQETTGLEAEILGRMNDLIEETEEQLGAIESRSHFPSENAPEIQAERRSSMANEDTLSAPREDEAASLGEKCVPVRVTNRPFVLAVDDSPSVRELVAMTLERVGYDVTTAADGVAALNLLAERLPVLILSDISMPRISGYKLCRLIKKHERTRHIPFLMLSGSNGVFDKVRAQIVGCAGYVSKPFETHDLIDKVRRYALQINEND